MDTLQQKELGPFSSLILKQLPTLEIFLWWTLPMRRDNIANQACWNYISLTTIFCTSDEYSHWLGRGWLIGHESLLI